MDKSSPRPTGTEILASVPQLDAELGAAKIKKSAAQLAFAEGAPYGEVEAARAEVLRLQDLRQGRFLLAARRTHAELSAEIDRRHADHEQSAEVLARLKSATRVRKPAPDGTGTAFGLALRAQREDAQDAFSRYEFANVQHIDRGRELAELLTRRDAIERDNPDAFAF